MNDELLADLVLGVELEGRVLVVDGGVRVEEVPGAAAAGDGGRRADAPRGLLAHLAGHGAGELAEHFVWSH